MRRRQLLKILAGGAALAITPSFLLRDRQQALAAKLALDSDDVYWLVSVPWIKMIAAAEGTAHLGKEAYQTAYRYRKFSGYADHPRIDIPIPGDPRNRTSDAAGPYQIISTTWDLTHSDYPDIWLKDEPSFSPANQDRCALAISDRTGGSAALLAGVKVLNGHLSVSYAAFQQAIYRDSSEWASLPGHDIGADSGQHTRQVWWLWSEFQWQLWGQCGYRRRIVAPLEAMTMTSPFGPRWGDLHGGIDFAAAVGTPVRSPENAKVIRVDRDDRAGLYVVLSPEGFPDLNLSFCHLSRTDMKEGDSLKAGETFALSGATGRITGPHLHIGAWIDGGIIDPGRYLKMAEWF